MRLDKGYDQPVGEGGNLLSVGQKQLISLTRAIMARPEIFVMDEATSSVDTLTEALIQKGMENLMRELHQLRHRPPPVDHQARQPHSGDRRWAYCRSRHPRRTAAQSVASTTTCTPSSSATRWKRPSIHLRSQKRKHNPRQPAQIKLNRDCGRLHRSQSLFI
jgi:hypothetical protein